MAYPLPAPQLVRWGLLLPVALALLLGAAWLWLSRPTSWQMAVMGVAIALGAVGAWRMPLWPRGTFLRWTGTKWGFASFDNGDESVLPPLQLMLDGQVFLLIRLRWASGAQAHPHWVLLLRASQRQGWGDIRRAVYASVAADRR